MTDGNETRAEFLLLPGRTPWGTPLMIAMMAGYTALRVAGAAGAPERFVFAAGLGAALALGTLASLLARRSIPDRVRLAPDAVELARGRSVVRRVRLARLGEVNEVQTAAGPVLVLGDHRHTMTVAQAQLAEPRRYAELSRGIVDLVERVDPTGEVGRRAVRAGRLRDTLAQRPVRGTLALGGAVALASMLGIGARDSLASRPFVDEALGALSAPLVMGGETFRLFSYVFLHADAVHLLLVVSGLLWLGAYLEKLLGWERMLLGFTAGALGGALGHLLFTPVRGLGASGGVFGLLGMLAVVSTMGRSRVPRALLPRPTFWVMTAMLGLMLPGAGLTGLPVIGPLAHLGGALFGFLLGAVFLAGMDLPASEEAKKAARPFALIACAALAVGLFGGATHAARAHPDDADIVAHALLSLPPTRETAVVLNATAYPMLARPEADPDTIELAERLAHAAVAQSDRKEPSILDTLAVARYRRGHADEASELLLEALELVQSGPLRRLLERRLADVRAGGELSPDEVLYRPD